MEAVSKPISITAKPKNIRPFEIHRDLEQVANLVELCFADTIDPDGKRYLDRMRSAARNKSLLRWAKMAPEIASLPLIGYVWQKDEKIVGNITLIPYYAKRRRFFLIANVAVHPDYRHRGIARELTRRGMKHARERGAPAVWLHVREENAAAVKLYKTLGFKERTRRTSWISKSDMDLDDRYDRSNIQHPGTRYWNLHKTWLVRSYPPELSWHMPLNLNNLNPGFIGAISRFIHSTYTRQWAVVKDKKFQGAVSWQPTISHANALWMAVPPVVDKKIVHDLLVHARRHAPSQKPLMLDYPAHEFEDTIKNAGFTAQQTLIWMFYSF
jgi:ribosomal protein S18 acetylase RimI-like enzyme